MVGKGRWGWLALAVVGVALAGWRIASNPPWPEVAAEDLRFIHETLGTHHPGPVDTVENPWFRDWWEDGYREADALARRATDYAGYYFAVKRYVHGFQDVHLSALRSDPLDDPRLSFRWPGIVLGWELGRFRVAWSGDERVPPGAALRSCDGKSAERLGEEVLQAYYGVWSVPGNRPDLAPHLFIDAGNPFVERASTCSFELDGSTVEVPLTWREADAETLEARVEEARQGVEPPFGVRRFAGGRATWISLPSFLDGADSAAVEIDRVVEALRRDLAAVRDGRVVVLDVRGNQGGSSTLGLDVARALWGDRLVEEARPPVAGVDWRASPGNIRHQEEETIPWIEERYGPGSTLARTRRALAEGMREALEEGRALYRQASGSNAGGGDGGTAGLRSPVAPRVYLLTDHACVSACLDFVDVVLRIPGVLHVGRETRADAVYMENRSVSLPSGYGRLAVSMKVYRGRVRGHNESYRPAHRWEGDMRDTGALEAWILALDGTSSDR